MSSRPCRFCACSGGIGPKAGSIGGLRAAWRLCSRTIPTSPALSGSSGAGGRHRRIGASFGTASGGSGSNVSTRVIDLQCLARSASFGWLANGQLTIGLDTPREAARGFYDIVVRRPSFHTHAVDWYLQVLPVLGVPIHADFEWLPVRPEVAAEVRRKWPVQDGRWIAVQPGARWQTKRWPIESYAALLQHLLGIHPGIRIAILARPTTRSWAAGWPSSTPTLPGFDGANFAAGSDRMDSSQRADGHQRHRSDAHGGRFRQALGRPLRAHRTAPHRSLPAPG